MLRLSSYFILSDRLQNGGYAVLNGLTGAIELINESLYGLFDEMIRTGNPHELYIEEDALMPEMMETFVKRGHITAVSHDEERAHLQRVAAVFHDLESKVPAVEIVPDLDCNYRCTYCFEQSMQKNLPGQKTTMDKDDVDAAYLSIDQLSSEIGYMPSEMVLFGGEPLMAKNLDVVKYIVDKGLERGMKFRAITNGHDLHAFIPLLGKDKIESLQITIDGVKSIHDQRRISLDGLSSYERIIENIRLAIAETDVVISIRVNIDQTNYQSFGALLGAFGEEGWINHPQIVIYATIVQQREASGAMIETQDINSARAELWDLVREYSNVYIGCQQSSGSDALFSTLLSGKPFGLQSSGCGASCGMYIFLPNGKISCCMEVLDDECCFVGSYDKNGLMLDKSRAQHLFGRSAAKIPACADCRYCLVCAGGCARNAEYETGDVYSPNCADFPDTYAWVLADAVEKFLKSQGV